MFQGIVAVRRFSSSVCCCYFNTNDDIWNCCEFNCHCDSVIFDEIEVRVCYNSPVLRVDNAFQMRI